MQETRLSPDFDILSRPTYGGLEDMKHVAPSNPTTLKLPQIQATGHKLAITIDGPRHCNSEADWFSFFQVHGEVTKQAIEIHQKEGLQALVALRGKKWVKNFLKFLSTLAQWQKQVQPEVA